MFDKLNQRLNSLGNRIISIIKKVFVQRGKDATGQTLASLRQETVFDVNSVAELDIYGSKTFDYIEEGRRAGAKMPPEGVLLNWMQSRGIPASAEFAIRRSISINGIAPEPIIEFSFIQVQREFKNDVSEKIIDDILETLISAFKKGFQFIN